MSTSTKEKDALPQAIFIDLTNESLEIRMRAFEHVETSLMRCLHHEEAINFKPVVLVKQLIRWFGFTPPTAPDRVLALLLELMRSDYGDVIIRKIPCRRFQTELGKIRQILRGLSTERCLKLLDKIESLLDIMYNSSGESQSSISEMAFSVDSFHLHGEDYETAWSRASLNDLATMTTIVDGLTVENDQQLQQKLINIQIKVCDYPVEYLLQTPNMYLHLLHMQKLQQSSETLFHINRALLTIVKLMQYRIGKRTRTIHYAKCIESDLEANLQLRIPSALGLLLTGCLDQVKRPELEHCAHNWQLIELIVQVIKTFAQLGAPMPGHHVQRLGAMVPELISYCNSIDLSNVTETRHMAKVLMMPRLGSLIFNGLLLDVIMQNASTIDRATGLTLLQPLILDSSYLWCEPQRRHDLSQLYGRIIEENTLEQKQMALLKAAYELAVGQLLAERRLPPLELLAKQCEISYVLVQLGSECLLQQLCDAIVKCTSLYMSKPELRNQAETLLLTVFDLPDKDLRNYALRLLKQPVVEHFHAFMNKTNYFPGCSNLQLARQHILGLPIGTGLLRKLLVAGWRPLQSFPPQALQQWCVDYLIMLLGLAKLIPACEFAIIFKMVMPVVPLLVCRAINQPQLQLLLWQLFEPDGQYVETPQALRGNICYLFHPDAEMRKDAMARVAYILITQDHQLKYRPAMHKLSLDLLGHNLCVINPPIEYASIFCDRRSAPATKTMPALLRLLGTPDLKPAIRKSTLVQLNILMHSWLAAHTYASCDGAYVLCLRVIHDLILCAAADDADTLQPAVGILLRVLCCSERFRREFSDNVELLVCLMRCIFLLPHSQQLCAEASTCIFLLLFDEHITVEEGSLHVDVDLSAMSLPVTYVLSNSVSPTFAMRGLAMQEHLRATHFAGSAALDAQYWRLLLAHCVCGSAGDLTMSTIHELDIRESLKVRASEVALVHATQVHRQLQYQLAEASNCSSHEMLQQLVASIQMFLVFKRVDVESVQCKRLWMMLHKYLRLMPSNDADRKLYTELLELCRSCLRHRLTPVLHGLCEALRNDPDHSFVLILHDSNVSLHLLHLVTECLVLLISSPQHNQTNNISWHNKLFMELSILTRTNFQLRNLQHVRCLLRVLRQLSNQPLNLDDAKLQSYYQQFVQLSSSLRTNTQTGAQWQRDCLLIICQLQANSKFRPADSLKSGSGLKVLRYLMGLCGHGDGEVRTVAWVAVANWCTSSGDKLPSVLLDFNDFLPSGLAECCLVTLLNANELMLVRELAGRLFELLMPHTGIEACNLLLQRHSFHKEAHLALGALHVASSIRPDGDRSSAKHSCEIIGCYVSICVRLIVLNPISCATHVQSAFINALSDVMKMPKTEMTKHLAYMNLCAGNICRLYSLCYQHNVQFIQRSICRDTLLIDGYYSLMDIVLDQQLPVPQNHLIELLKLLMVFFKDEDAYKYLCLKFRSQPNMLCDLIMYGLSLDFVHGTVQQYTLATLSLLLAKVLNSRDELNVLVIFEEYVNDTSDEHEDDGETVMDTDTNTDSDRENTLNKQLQILSLKTVAKQKKPKSKTPNNPKQAMERYARRTGTSQLYHRLDRLFELHYPNGKYSFLHPPTKSHVQVCEVLGNLLKLSSQVTDMATSCELMQRVLHLIETFLDDATVGSATVYVRRVGAHKTRDIINNLLVQLNMLMNWHSASHAVITDPQMAIRFVRVLLRLWPWISHSMMLKHMTVRLSMLLTEHSLEMCKQTSLLLSNHSHSLLQLMVRLAEHETSKKEPTADNSHADSIIDAALRVMINCCSCIEGRLGLSKMRVLDMFDTVLPASGRCTKATKVKPEVRLSWLAFWEIFSRYEQGSKICHFDSLLSAVRRNPPLCILRLRCLRILRNMCFSNGNRMQLVALTEFVDLLRDIVSQPVQDGLGERDTNIDPYVEHHLVVLCLWKLFGFSAKCRAMLRGTKLHKQLIMLSDHLADKQTDAFEKLSFAIELRDLLEKLFESLES
ncbi:uncharacterized protein LOC6565415 [Drosophila grimshawi]|uniref:GH12425 n=1 Tax=Drosophila grimshawi TaxID=7222 RepID=B4JJ25_DROGR|nr:uncharacterized protein LOC6565415 [Drosophila grimshawi]XP_043071366.1 uncharacterized protein LOC6565415 [Drosophila grimshawi]EDV99577.1 GH12425 [Drosophila grimshawi]